MPSNSILSFNAAELMLPEDVPELGDLYDATTGKRVAAFKVTNSDALSAEGATFPVSTTATNVATVHAYELSNVSFSSVVKGMDISAEAEVHLMEGKINLHAKFDWTKRDESTDDVIHITKGVRIVTHRRTINRQDFLESTDLKDALGGTLKKANDVLKVTHFASEILYGHFATMTVSFQKKLNLSSSIMSVGGDGDIKMETFHGSLQGQVDITNVSTSGSTSFTVTFASSQPYANPQLPIDDDAVLYEAATNAFNDIARQISTDIAASSKAVAVGFTYSPISLLQLRSGLATIDVDGKARDRAVGLYAGVKTNIIRLSEITRHPDVHYFPRLQRELEFLLQQARELRAEVQDALLAATATAEKSGSYDGYVGLLATYKIRSRQLDQVFALYPVLPERLMCVQRHIYELDTQHVSTIGSVAELHPVSNTTAAAPCRVAIVNQWDGRNKAQLYRLADDGAPGAYGRWAEDVLVGPLNPEAGCIATNHVVRVAQSRQPVPCVVMDQLSFLDANVASSGVVSGQVPPSTAPWYVRGLKDDAAGARVFKAQCKPRFLASLRIVQATSTRPRVTIRMAQGGDAFRIQGDGGVATVIVPVWTSHASNAATQIVGINKAKQNVDGKPPPSSIDEDPSAAPPAAKTYAVANLPLLQPSDSAGSVYVDCFHNAKGDAAVVDDVCLWVGSGRGPPGYKTVTIAPASAAPDEDTAPRDQILLCYHLCSAIALGGPAAVNAQLAFVETGVYRIEPVGSDTTLAVGFNEGHATSEDRCADVREGVPVSAFAADVRDASQEWVVKRVGYDTYAVQAACRIGVPWVWTAEGAAAESVSLGRDAATMAQRFRIEWAGSDAAAGDEEDGAAPPDADVFTIKTLPSEKALAVLFDSAALPRPHSGSFVQSFRSHMFRFHQVGLR